jgi:hypothetical protein
MIVRKNNAKVAVKVVCHARIISANSMSDSVATYMLETGAEGNVPNMIDSAASECSDPYRATLRGLGNEAFVLVVDGSDGAGSWSACVSFNKAGVVRCSVVRRILSDVWSKFSS